MMLGLAYRGHGLESLVFVLFCFLVYAVHPAHLGTSFHTGTGTYSHQDAHIASALTAYTQSIAV